jgi:hypothetical protein
MHDAPPMRDSQKAIRAHPKARHVFALACVCIAFLSAMSTVAADEVPKFDVTPTCRAGESAGTAQYSFPACMQKEKQARDQLKTDWAQFTKSDKARCIQTCKCGGLTPSYIELLTCLEMASDVKRLHKGGGPASISSHKEK